MMRLQLRKGKIAIEAENDDHGRAYLEGLRSLRPALFGRGRITEILQLGFQQTGIVYVVNGPQLGEPWKVSDRPLETV